MPTIVDLNACNEHYSITPRDLFGCGEEGVVDDGVGVETDRLREGIGLRNTRQRLTEMYDGRQSFRVFRSDEGGFGVELILPFHDGSLDGS